LWATASNSAPQPTRQCLQKALKTITVAFNEPTRGKRTARRDAAASIRIAGRPCPPTANGLAVAGPTTRSTAREDDASPGPAWLTSRVGSSVQERGCGPAETARSETGLRLGGAGASGQSALALPAWPGSC